MPINSVPVTILDASAALATGTNGVADFAGGGATYATLPVVTGDGGVGAVVRGLGSGTERTRAGRRAILNVGRNDDAGGVLAGSFAIYGVDLPDGLSGKPKGNAYATDQAETVQVFKNASAIAVGNSSTFDASALGTAAINADSKGYNWLVVVNGVIIPWASGALANSLSWSIAAGVVTLRAGSSTVSVPAGSDIVVYKLATADVTEVLAAGAHPIEMTGIRSRQVMWTYWTVNQGAADRTVITLLPAVGE